MKTGDINFTRITVLVQPEAYLEGMKTVERY